MLTMVQRVFGSRGSGWPGRLIACVGDTPRSGAVAAEAWRLSRRLGGSCVLVHCGDRASAARVRQSVRRAGVPSDAELMVRSEPLAEAVGKVDGGLGAGDLVVAGVLGWARNLRQHRQSMAGQLALSLPCSVLLLRRPQAEARRRRLMMGAMRFDATSRRMAGAMAWWARSEPAAAALLLHQYTVLRGRREGRDDREQRRRRLAAIGQAHDWGAAGVRVAAMRGGDAMAPLWLASVMHADLLWLAVTRARQRLWEARVRSGLEVEFDDVPCDLMLYRGA